MAKHLDLNAQRSRERREAEIAAQIAGPSVYGRRGKHAAQVAPCQAYALWLGRKHYCKVFPAGHREWHKHTPIGEWQGEVHDLDSLVKGLRGAN